MPPPPVSPLVLSFEDARHAVEEHAGRIVAGETESVDLLAASGRVVSEQILADRHLPPFPRATRDGYAVRSADLAEIPASFDVIAEIKAGERLDRIPTNMGAGQAASIMTGAPVPQCADAVVMVEYTAQDGSRVEIAKRVQHGENIVPIGAEAKAGSVLIERGTRLGEAAIALAASAGKSNLAVYKRPRVADPDHRR